MDQKIELKENDKENTLHENNIENSFILGNQKIIKKYNSSLQNSNKFAFFRLQRYYNYLEYASFFSKILSKCSHIC